MERGRIQGLSKFFGYPLLSQERLKLRTSHFVGTFIGSIGTKAHEKFWEQWPWAYSQGVQKIFRAPTYRAHCAVIFAIAQLSHEVPHWLYIHVSKFTRLRAVSRRQHGSCFTLVCWFPRLTYRSLLLPTIDSVCPSVCLSHFFKLLLILFCFSMESSHFLAVISPCAPEQNLFLRYLI